MVFIFGLIFFIRMSSKFIKYNLYTFTRTNNLKIVKKKNSKLLKLNAYIDNYNEYVQKIHELNL